VSKNPRALLAALLSVAFVVEIPASAIGAAQSSRLSRAVIGAVSAVPPVRIPVKEPLRVKQMTRPANAIRARVVQGIRPASGRRAAGPPMLSTSDVGRVALAAHRAPPTHEQPAAGAQIVPPPPPRALPIATRPPSRFLTPQAVQNCNPGLSPIRKPRTVVVTPTPDPGVTPTPCPNATPIPGTPTPVPTATPAGLTVSGTGINPWWSYQQTYVPGGGHVMVNVGTGNMLLQDEDMSVPHKGLPLGFRRTYNSQSRHDINATDAAGEMWIPPGMYGNGWTNAFDAHLARTTGTTFSVYDGDGARYDYTQDLSGPSPIFIPRAGNHTSLVFDGNCGFLWTKKNGIIYYFYRPNPAQTCGGPSTGGFAGRLYQIMGRNHNTAITLSYAWDNNDSSTAGKINTITATTDSGQTATLSFADFNAHRLLQQLTFPDGTTTVTYAYDEFGNLTDVSLPPNNSSAIRPHHWYGYAQTGSDYVMSYAASPRWVAACNTDNCGGDGSYLSFGFAGTGALLSTMSSIMHFALVNPTISDGTGSGSIQAGFPTYAYNYLTEYYSTGVTTPTFRDTDGHVTNWIVDGAARATQIQRCTACTTQGAGNPWLVTNTTWDADNNRVLQTDARGDATEYAYDTNGNLIAVGEPSVATSQGTFRPTRRYSYDGFNNVTAVCDEITTHAIPGGDWTTPPPASDTLCPRALPATQFSWVPPASGAEPFGQLASVTDGKGYQQRVTHDTFGLVTNIAGDPIPQNDGTTVNPSKTYAYDSVGRQTSANNGVGTSTMAYDVLGRLTTSTDPDGPSSYVTYFADGSVSSAETPQQHAAHLGQTIQYDLDGNPVSETRHHNNSPGVTTRWFDGAGRLVEVSLPHDASDAAAYAWMTRYVYDLSGRGSIGPVPSLNGGTPLGAHGGLAKTQTYIPGGVPTNTAGTPAWTDLRGYETDGVDRPTATYETAYGTGAVTAVTYDTRGYLGLASQIQNGTGQTAVPEYDAIGRRLSESYTGDNGLTPGRSFVYDPDGRAVSVTSTDVGTQTFTFDANGNETSMSEPVNSAVDSPAVVSYQYYPDDSRKKMTVASSAFTMGTVATAYSYRADGQRTKQVYADSNGNHALTFSYTNAGRLLSRTDPLTGTVVAGVTMVPETIHYDAYGQSDGLTLPRDGTPNPAVPRNGTYSNIVYDAESNVTSMNAFGHGTSPALKEEFTYTARGEVSNISLHNVSDDSLYKTVESHAYFNGSDTNSMTDVRTGQVVQQGRLTLGRPGSVQFNFSYDSAGRQYAATSQFTVDAGPPHTATYLRKFDASNRIRSQVVNSSTGWPFATALDNTGTVTSSYPTEVDYTYWPNGRLATELYPAVGAAQAPPTTYHWDGSQLLFTSYSWTNPPSTSATVYQDNEVAYTYDSNKALVQTQVFDRDVTQSMASAHWTLNGGTSYGAWQGPEGRPGHGADRTSPYPAPSSSGDMSPFSCSDACSYSALAAFPRRTDGFETGVLTFQGVRTYDPLSQQWTTPDALGGFASDPMSQRSYAWNGNNPLSNQDPSGYITQNNTPSIIVHGSSNDLPFDNIGPLLALVDMGGANGIAIGELLNDRIIGLVTNKAKPQPEKQPENPWPCNIGPGLWGTLMAQGGADMSGMASATESEITSAALFQQGYAHPPSAKRVQITFNWISGATATAAAIHPVGKVVHSGVAIALYLVVTAATNSQMEFCK
jgi:YD repeat-containing protein